MIEYTKKDAHFLARHLQKVSGTISPFLVGLVRNYSVVVMSSR